MISQCLFFCTQIYQHQISAVQALAKCMGWQFLANSSHLGLGSVEPLGNASSCILASPIGDRYFILQIYHVEERILHAWPCLFFLTHYLIIFLE